jgi:hypothetical protein
VQRIYTREEQAREVSNRYTPGTTVPVYYHYHPRKPSVATRELENPLHALFGVVAGAVLAGMGWWWLAR